MMSLTFDQRLLVASALRESICARYRRRHCYRRPAGIMPADPRRTAEIYSRIRGEIAALRLFLSPKSQIQNPKSK